MSDILSDLRILYEREGDMAHLRAADEIERNRGAIAELVQALKEAEEMVRDWGSYADPYYKEKWDLSGDIAKLHAAYDKYDTTTKETK